MKPPMSRNRRVSLGILWGVFLGCLGLMFWLKPVAQDPRFHDFVDQESFMGIPNFLNAEQFAVSRSRALGLLQDRGPTLDAVHAFRGAGGILFGRAAGGFASVWAGTIRFAFGHPDHLVALP